MTLAELDALTNDTPPTPSPAPTPLPAPPTNIKPGDGTPAPTDLEAERQRQLQNPTPTPAPAVPDPVKTQAQIEDENLAKGLNADGTAKTPEQVKQEELEEEEDEKVWEEVDKMWGTPLEVEYKNAAGEDVHPNSPEGIFLREQGIANRAVTDFEAFLERTDPRSYAYVLHRRNGLPDADFFNTKSVTLPTYEEFQNSVDLKVRVYKESLYAKGMSEEEVKATVDWAVANKKIDTLSDAAYKNSEKEQKAEIDRLAEANRKSEETFTRQVQALNKSLSEEMTGGMRVIIPADKKVDFERFVRSHLAVDGGQFFFSQPIDQKNLPHLLDMMYFHYAKGNLNELVQREAQSKNVVRLRSNVRRSSAAPAAGDTPPGKRKMTLGEL